MPRATVADRVIERIAALEGWLEELSDAVRQLARATGHGDLIVPDEPVPSRIDPDPATRGPRRRRAPR